MNLATPGHAWNGPLSCCRLCAHGTIRNCEPRNRSWVNWVQDLSRFILVHFEHFAVSLFEKSKRLACLSLQLAYGHLIISCISHFNLHIYVGLYLYQNLLLLKHMPDIWYFMVNWIITNSYYWYLLQILLIFINVFKDSNDEEPTQADSTNDSEDSFEKEFNSGCFALLLHSNIKTEGTAAIVTLGKDWYGALHCWTNSKSEIKNKSYLMISLFEPGWRLLFYIYKNSGWKVTFDKYRKLCNKKHSFEGNLSSWYD